MFSTTMLLVGLCEVTKGADSSPSQVWIPLTQLGRAPAVQWFPPNLADVFPFSSLQAVNRALKLAERSFR